MKGFRESGRKERLKALEVELKNLQASLRISQLMTKNLMNSIQGMQHDLGKAFGIINELQYKVLAMQQAANLDVDALNGIASTLRLNDFNEASDKEDADSNFTVGDVVKDDSTVIITSTTPGVTPDAGIFRSRVELATCGVPALIEALKGQPVGVKVTVQLNKVDHEIELLAIRQPPQPIPVPQESEVKPLEVVTE